VSRRDRPKPRGGSRVQREAAAPRAQATTSRIDPRRWILPIALALLIDRRGWIDAARRTAAM
jgi:hypothetical protein